MIDHVKVGDTIRVNKECPLDKYASSEKVIWKIGEEFTVKEITVGFGDVFLHDGKGNNLNPKRAEKVVII